MFDSLPMKVRTADQLENVAGWEYVGEVAEMCEAETFI
jgi:hypothetical protein